MVRLANLLGAVADSQGARSTVHVEELSGKDGNVRGGCTIGNRGGQNVNQKGRMGSVTRFTGGGVVDEANHHHCARRSSSAWAKYGDARIDFRLPNRFPRALGRTAEFLRDRTKPGQPRRSRGAAKQDSHGFSRQGATPEQSEEIAGELEG